MQRAVSVRILRFLLLCPGVFCSKHVMQLSGRFALWGGLGGFVVKFLQCRKLLNFQSCVLKHTEIDACKLDATF